jgi:DNA-binding NarL/FixJ family response regulator
MIKVEINVLKPNLTEREIQILNLAKEGLNDKEIGETLYITHGTVKQMMFTIRNRLGTNNRTHSVITAIRRGYIGVEDNNDRTLSM